MMTVLGALLLGVVVVAVILYRFVSAYWKLRERVTVRYKRFIDKVDFFQQRYQLISEYALDYMNSLTPEGARAMYQLQQLLTSQQKLVEELQDWVKSEDMTVLADADRILFEMLSAPDGKVAADGQESPGSKLDNWEIRFEELLQLVGKDVAAASREAKRIGVPKRRDRKPTSMTLKTAGIVAAQGDPETEE